MNRKRNDCIPTFEEGLIYSNAPSSSGISTLSQFSKSEDDSKTVDALKSYGLTDREIKIYIDLRNGALDDEYKSIDASVMSDMIDVINKKVNQGIKSKEGVEIDERMKNDSVKNQLEHPMNYIRDIKDDLFGHLDNGELPPLNKRLKFMRRMNRKINKIDDLPTPGVSKDSDKSTDHHYNDFVKCGVDEKIFRTNRKPTSKWDVKEVDPLPDIRNSKPPLESKIKGCSGPSMYTIKDNKIVRVEGKERSILANGELANEAEGRLFEGAKLNVEEIRRLPKFETYRAGEPSETLYLKNISPKVQLNDLKRLFTHSEDLTDLRLMSGKMKGQAFATFDSIPSACKALETLNGTFLKDKPIIIQFGSGKR